MIIQLFSAFILATVDIDSHHGSKDIKSSDIKSFFSGGIENYCNSSYTFGAMSHSMDLIKKFEESQWNASLLRTSLYAPYAAWYERVYYGNCGPSNNWTQAEFGGTALPNISWNLGMDSDWAYVYKGPIGTNYYPHVLIPNVTRRLTEWESLMDLQDGVREFCDGREEGTPIMTRGKYWRGDEETFGEERRIYWSSQHLTSSIPVTPVEWKEPGDWVESDKLTYKFLPIGGLAPGGTLMHNERFNPTESSPIPSRYIAETISRTDPGGVSEESYNVTNSFEDNISYYFGLNNIGCTNLLQYNAWKLCRIVNDYYGMYEGLGTEETNFVYYSSNVAAASRALAMLDRTYEIVNENGGYGLYDTNFWNTKYEFDVNSYNSMTGVTKIAFYANSILHNGRGELFFNIVPVSDQDINIDKPKAPATPTINIETNIAYCDARWDYAWCSGANLGYVSTKFDLSRGDNYFPYLTNTIPVSAVKTTTPICPGGTNTLYRLYFETHDNDFDDLIYADFYIYEDGIKIGAGYISRNVDWMLDIPFFINVLTTVNVESEYEYSFSKNVNQKLINKCWRYAGPSSIAIENNRVEGLRMHYGAGVYSKKNVTSEPNWSNLIYYDGIGQFEECCALFANRSSQEMLAWREDGSILEIRSTIRNKVFEYINHWYSGKITEEEAFLDPLWSVNNWSFLEPFATIDSESVRNITSDLIVNIYGVTDSGDRVDVVYALMAPDGSCLDFKGLLNGEVVDGVNLMMSCSVGSPHIDVEKLEISYEPPILKSEIQNSWSAAADSKNAIVIETDWKWKNLGFQFDD